MNHIDFKVSNENNIAVIQKDLLPLRHAIMEFIPGTRACKVLCNLYNYKSSPECTGITGNAWRKTLYTPGSSYEVERTL